MSILSSFVCYAQSVQFFSFTSQLQWMCSLKNWQFLSVKIQISFFTLYVHATPLYWLLPPPSYICTLCTCFYPNFYIVMLHKAVLFTVCVASLSQRCYCHVDPHLHDHESKWPNIKTTFVLYVPSKVSENVDPHQLHDHESKWPNVKTAFVLHQRSLKMQIVNKPGVDFAKPYDVYDIL